MSSEAEIEHRIQQALKIAKRLTIAMLQAHLTSRVTNGARDAVLSRMTAKGIIAIRELSLQSIRGRASTVRVIELVEKSDGKAA
jgi:hypothetical protein